MSLTTQPYLYGLPISGQNQSGFGCSSVCEPVNNCPSDSYISLMSNCPAPVVTTDCTVDQIEKPWIDIYLRDNFEYGWRVIDTKSGVTDLSLIPQYLIKFCPDQTDSKSRGYEMGTPFCIPGTQGEWQKYLKVVGTRAFQYIKNLKTGEERQGGDWDFGIYDCAIVSLDAGKLFNTCNFLSKIAEPITKYLDPTTQTLSAGYRKVPVVYTASDNCTSDNCSLSALIKCSEVRACVIPSLTTQKGPLWTYNVITDASPVFNPENLDCLVSVCIDGTTIRAKDPVTNLITANTNGGNAQRPGGTILVSYTYADGTSITGDGTPANPLKASPAIADGVTVIGKGTVSDPFRTPPSAITSDGDYTWYFEDLTTKATGDAKFTQIEFAPAANAGIKLFQFGQICNLTNKPPLPVGKTRMRLFVQYTNGFEILQSYRLTNASYPFNNNVGAFGSLLYMPGTNISNTFPLSARSVPALFDNSTANFLSSAVMVDVEYTATAIYVANSVGLPLAAPNGAASTFSNTLSVTFMKFI